MVQGQTVEENRKAPISIDFLFLKQAVPASLRCEVSDNHVPYPALYISSLPCLYNVFPSANASLPYFAVISAFLFSESLSISAEKHKNSSHEHFTDFTNRNAITAITFSAILFP